MQAISIGDHYYVIIRRKGAAVLRVASGFVPTSARPNSRARLLADFPARHWGVANAVRAAIKTAITFSIGTPG